MKRIHTTLLLIALLGLCLPARGQDSLAVLRPVTSSYTLEIGSAHLADTYLTPLHYRGTHMAVGYERHQALKCNPTDWTQQLRLQAVLDHTKNPAKNATLLNASVDLGGYLMRRWRLPHSLTLGFGGGASLDLGVLYLSRNSNNPASAKCSATIDATGYLAWTGHLWRLPLTVRYQPTMPLAGAFFAPDYGELYYQIYLGNHGGLAHVAWPGNFCCLDQLLTADLHLGATSLRIGYHGSIFSSKVNNTVTQNITHAIVIGITTEWISLRPSDRTVKGRIISSY